VVKEDGDLVMGGSKVGGNVQTEKAEFVFLLGNRVEGDVQVVETKSVVCEGKPNQICKNQIRGNLQLAKNEAPFEIGCENGNRVGGDLQVVESNIDDDYEVVYVLNLFKNQTKGNLQFDKNFAAFGFFNLEENRVGGNLQCDENNPRPQGTGNRVRGDTDGQCVGLTGNGKPPKLDKDAHPVDTCS